MRGHLDKEIRLQISVTRLKNSAVCYRLKIKEQAVLLKQKDKTIAELEAKLTNKESPRKELLTFLYKSNKKDTEKKPRGKVPGSPAYHRQIPKESSVTQEHTYTLKKCPICYKLYDFKISEGEIVNLLKDAEVLFGKDHKAIIELIQSTSVVYADETGWRMDGKNWFLWVFVTERGTQYVIEDTRGGGVPKRVLGEKEDRVLISDGYAVYQKIPGDKQQCWVHLLRKAKLHSISLYGDLSVLYKKLLLELEKPLEQRTITRLLFLRALITKGFYPRTIPQNELSDRRWSCVKSSVARGLLREYERTK